MSLLKAYKKLTLGLGILKTKFTRSLDILQIIFFWVYPNIFLCLKITPVGNGITKTLCQCFSFFRPTFTVTFKVYKVGTFVLYLFKINLLFIVQCNLN